MVCFRAALDSSDGLARVAHAHGGVLLSTGPQPLTQNRGKSEKQNFPITPGKEEEREEEEEGRAQQKRQFRAWADGDAAGAVQWPKLDPGLLHECGPACPQRLELGAPLGGA